jgi:sec-independent protein translocase protein TatB
LPAVFGFSLSELVVVIVVALVVIGPKDLPKMLRKLGQYSGKLRRMASELRSQSGIDEALRTEGLAEDIAEIRKLARGELDAVQRAAVDLGPSIAGPKMSEPAAYRDDFYVVRDREYPRDGADAYGALPDNAIVYAEGLPKSKLARDPLYMLGDASGVLPPEAASADATTTAEATSAEATTAAEATSADATTTADAPGGDTKATAEAPGGAERVDPSEAETMDPPAVAARAASEARG